MADESLTERMRRLIEESRRGTATEPDTDALLFSAIGMIPSPGP